MSRLNGRVHHAAQNPVQYQPVPTQYGGQMAPQYTDNSNAMNREEFEATCLVRTPSGNVYIPSGDLPPNCGMDYRSNITSTGLPSPVKDTQKTVDSYTSRLGGTMGMPVIPMRNNVRRDPLTSPYESGIMERPATTSSRRHLSLANGDSKLRCSWRCTAVIFITIAVVLAVLFGFVAVQALLSGVTNSADCNTSVHDTTPDEVVPVKSPERGNQGSEENQKQSGFLRPRKFGIWEKSRMRRSLSHDKLSMKSFHTKTPIPVASNISLTHNTTQASTYNLLVNSTIHNLIAKEKFKSNQPGNSNGNFQAIEEYVVYDEPSEGNFESHSSNLSSSFHEYEFGDQVSNETVESSEPSSFKNREQKMPVPPETADLPEYKPQTKLVSLLSDKDKKENVNFTNSNGMMNDGSIFQSKRSPWSLGWIFNTKPSTDVSDTVTNVYTEKNIEIKPKNTVIKGGKKTYTPFSTWSDNKASKGGLPHVETEYQKGGKVNKKIWNDVQSTGLKNADYKYNQLESYQSYNDADPKLEQKYHQNSKDTFKGSTAMDFFPHLFEYELPNHDDYYYEDENEHWFDEFWTDDETFIDDSEEIKEPERLPTTTLPSTTSTSPIPVKFPEGLKVMSLTKAKYRVVKENFTPEIPESSIDIIKSPSFLSEDVEIVPIEENKDIPLKNVHKKSVIRNKSENEVYGVESDENSTTTQIPLTSNEINSTIKFETTTEPDKVTTGYQEALRKPPFVVYADDYPHFELPGNPIENDTSVGVTLKQNVIGVNQLDTLPFINNSLPRRVTVNVTINTDDFLTGKSKLKNPFYQMSISIPVMEKADEPNIQIQPTNDTNDSMNMTTEPSCSCPCATDIPEVPTGCVIVVQNNTTPQPSTFSTTLPTLPPDLIFEMEEHHQRPQKTIPPDGTTFRRTELGEKLRHSIPPYGYWNMQFHQPESAYIKFEVVVPRGASLGIYGRRNALPTHTSYDFINVLSGYKVGSKRNTRSSMAPTQLETIVKYMEQGHWFISVYNDDGDPQDLTFSATVSTEYTEGCPKGCSGNGACILGSCRCKPGFTGTDCTEMKCPILCSGHGEYKEGQCICKPGWKGQECSVRHDECEVPDCYGHGHCVDGRCRCAKGFKGQYCQDVDCPHPTCSDHGWCVNGTCICQKGWRSPDCSRMDDAALQCLPDCSSHGHFDLEGQQCVCEPEWTGSECNVRVCGIDCGPHGRCEGGQCLCTDEWTGDRCDLKRCDQRCENHGQCKNGTCICMTGWNGRHCTLVGCPNSCSSNGICINVDDEWQCDCQDGWEGVDCSMKLERICDDGFDNDNDDLVDCADAECCSSENCLHSTLCKSSVDPIDILLRKQPPAVTASFFQRMRFIVEESSVQIYAEMQSFNQSDQRIQINESRASVIRGRIVSGRGSGLIGVRISHVRPQNTGFTLSRHGGWFDLMVNGGGAVKLLFGKSQFLPVTKTVSVPWNEIVVIDTVVMTTTQTVPPPLPSSCPDHDYNTLKPVVLATWKHGFQGGCPQCTAILAESQVVQESLAIPGTGLQLVYHSSRAVGYESTIQLQLTPEEIPVTLKAIHLKITIKGILFEKTFEADKDIKYTFAWNRLNIYRQKVYGVTWALVRVGYAYTNCDQIIWDAQSTQVSGHDISVSDIGGWDLSIHHRYNFHEGILQKGDGRNLYLKQRPRVMQVLMGDGRQREVSCKNCDGPAKRQRLLTPAALAPSPDGSLYVADFNLIRRIYPDKTVKTVVKLNETKVSYRYHLAVSPVDGSVYISHPEAHQILKVRDPDDTSRPEQNYMTYVGSGERCLPGDEIGCGDGGLARDAKLQYPKGLVVSLKEVLYFADGTNVRSVDSDGIISTVIGTHRHRAHWHPLPCSGTLPVVDVSLRWPTSLVISPLDESLFVLDDHHVLRLTQDDRIKVVAGRPLHCPPVSNDVPSDLPALNTLRSPQSLAFDPNGNLYIAESDSERINRVRVITSDERIHSFAGTASKCNCHDDNCRCFDESHVLAANAVFSTISAIAITPDGTVYVLDQGNLRIRSITASIPQPNQERNYEVYSPETQEMYLFNRFGHHIETRNIPTHRTIYTFIYNVNTSNGKLSSVTDAAGNKINFLRDYGGQVTMIENSRQQKCRLKMSRMRRLEEIVTPDQHNVTLTYHGASGLLRSRMDSTGRAHVYAYDKYGRLTRSVTPSGQIIDLSFDLSENGARVTVTRDGESPVVMLIKGNIVTEMTGDASKITSQLADGSVVIRNSWAHHLSTETVPYALLQDQILASSFPVPGRQTTEIGQGLINSFDWKYYVDMSRDMSHIEQVGRRMAVNGENLLNFKYDLFSGTEAFVSNDRTTLLNVTYDDLGRPLRWSPIEPFNDVSLTYDRYGLIQQWSWGQQREDYVYDRSGRFEGIKYADNTKVTYSYKDTMSIKPYKMSVQKGEPHLLEYDEGGALSGITTPKGHRYRFMLQPSVLHNRLTFYMPASPKHPYQILYSDSGRLLAKVLPKQEGRVVYSYDKAGRLQHQIFGDGSVEYGYQPETGLIRSVTLRELAYEQRIDNKYHTGLVKEQRIRFGPAVPMHAAKMRFLYDGNARPRRIEIELNGKDLPEYEMKYNMLRGTLETIDNLKISHSNFNRTVIQDSTKTMLKIIDYNADWKIIEEALTIRGRLVHRFRYTYDLRGRVASKTIWREPAVETTCNYTYTPDGFLERVTGSELWQYKYDANGNIIGVVENNREIPARYDLADRLIGWGDQEINVHDDAGRVIRQKDIHYSFTARGNIRQAWNRAFRTTYRYDHQGRLTSWEDHLGNVTQFFYADLRRTHLPTHIHYPNTGTTRTLFYDDRDHITAINTETGKIWIVTDQRGSPAAAYDVSGILIKEIVRSPFGAIIQDTKPDLNLYIDFCGAIRDPQTGLLLFGLYPYDPVHAQWMSPRYDKIPRVPENIASIYMHRFENNNPVNNPDSLAGRFTDMHLWLRKFGIDMRKMLGSAYHDETIDNPQKDLEIDNIEPSIKVISGLSCSTQSILNQFSSPSFLKDSLVQMDEPRLVSSKWSMLGKFSSSGPVLGPGVLVSRLNGKALVTLVPSTENSVVQAVARDVLNGSALLDVTLPHHRHHTLYLIKEDLSAMSEDLSQLQRLSGVFNVTKHDGEYPEIRVLGSTASLLFMYGISADDARHHILRHVHHRSAEHAWKAEQRLLQTGGLSLHPWTPEEREILLREGQVPGFTAAELHSVHRFPLLADDASNVVFRRDVDRRRRRSKS